MKFKKLLAALMASSIILAGCSSKEETKKEEPKKEEQKKEQKKEDKYSSTTLVLDSPTGTSEITYYYEGDNVKIQTAKNVVKYAALGKTKEEVEKLFEPIAQRYKDTKGVKQHMDFGATEASEEVYVDYDEVDMKALRKLSGSQFTGDENSSTVSYSRSLELLKQAGFVVKSENKK